MDKTESIYQVFLGSFVQVMPSIQTHPSTMIQSSRKNGQDKETGHVNLSVVSSGLLSLNFSILSSNLWRQDTFLTALLSREPPSGNYELGPMISLFNIIPLHPTIYCIFPTAMWLSKMYLHKLVGIKFHLSMLHPTCHLLYNLLVPWTKLPRNP